MEDRLSHHASKTSQKEPESHLFKEINQLRKPDAGDDREALEKAMRNDTIFGKIAGSKKFEYTTLGIIVLNALFIGYDADFSARWHKPENLYVCGDFEPGSCYQFIIFENLFAVYFTVEVVVRFFAYRRKLDSLTDLWFLFDSVLVLFMVIETWILPVVGASGPLAQLSVLRLLRLLRITRMAKLMRFFPELQIIVKGMLAAVRSVVCTAILLILILYVWAILFTSEYHQGDKTDEEVEGTAEQLFGSMSRSMIHLFIMGTILDDITLCCNFIRGSSKSVSMMILFVIYVLISSFTMLNMLIGILCEVVCATGEGERNKNTEAAVREAITELFSSMDKDSDGEITRDEFLQKMDDKKVKKALAELEVKEKHFAMYADLMFKPEEPGGKIPTFDFDKTINMIMRLRPGTKVSALDFASFQMTVSKNHAGLQKHITNIEKMAASLVNGQDPSGALLPAVADEPRLDKMTDLELVTELQQRSANFAQTGNMPAASGQAFQQALPGNPDMAWSQELYTC